MSAGMSCSECGQKRAVPQYNINVDNVPDKAVREDRAGALVDGEHKERGLAFD